MMNKIKVIFLDIDGVLNVISQGHDEFGSLWHKHFIDNLRTIVEQTGAKIVISSTWRSSGLEFMRKMWNVREYPGEIIDVTPSLDDMINTGIYDFYDKVERGHEIQHWIDNHNVENYVILDDDNDMLPTQRSNFVRTANNRSHPDCIDIGYGLTKECANMAIKMLNKTIN